ncbi:HEAT repeat domain-containing protein [Cellulosimicrobium marinum]|uniref:HEAT repeat domain-containing protein n=1 Tax=Cellulosimicrobium marinum TaxID=1638992 RepID=UPI001E4A1AB1|nr:HEAT repeat domain-containing protein [Cellulosimicrobium marinum]MCB7138225.1 HEAT repeat domain-containing protein [Cellulosimicrobium marinum]
MDIARVIALLSHEDAEVRGRAVLELPILTHGEPPTTEMVAAAIALTTDPVKRVRDAACFVLGEQFREVDTPELRDALADRLDDVDRETRCEALVGLAYRRDPRALPQVRRALTRRSGDVWQLELVAAGALGDPLLHPLVAAHRTGWDDDVASGQADAAYRLTDPEGPGDDLLDGVAELSRRRGHGRPDGDSIGAWRSMSVLLDIAPFRAREFYDAVASRLEGDEAALHDLREGSALAQLADEARESGV